MRQYRPNVELQKLRYSLMKAGLSMENLIEKHTNKFWLPGGIGQISDAMMISDWLKDDPGLHASALGSKRDPTQNPQSPSPLKS